MLNLEYLLEEAESNGLPTLKRRAILREYLQTIILNGIYVSDLSKKIYFMGGTALRFFYNLPRFSEDLDFNASDLNSQRFKELIRQNVKSALLKEGFSVELSFKQRKKLFMADLMFKEVVQQYNITDDQKATLMIKVEVNCPKWELKTESKVLSQYGYNFSSILMSRGNLLSEKLSALLNRERGRDIYDLLFMLKRKFPFNEGVLKANKIKGNPKEVILQHLNSLTQDKLKHLAEQVRPFLFKEEDVELILKAKLYAEKFLENY